MTRAILRSMVLCTAVALTVVLAACESGEQADEPATQPAMGAINDKCPVMGGDVDPNAESVSYHGYTIGFCCDGCVSKWNAKSNADKNAFLAQHTGK